MPSFLYNSAKDALLNGNFDLLNDTIKVALVGNGYAPDKDADVYFDDVTDEIGGTGYTAGGKALTSKATVPDNANDRVLFDAADTVWPVSTFTAYAGVVYKDTGTAATSPLLAYIDFEFDFNPVGEDFTIEWDADGIFTLGEGA